MDSPQSTELNPLQRIPHISLCKHMLEETRYSVGQARDTALFYFGQMWAALEELYLTDCPKEELCSCSNLDCSLISMQQGIQPYYL